MIIKQISSKRHINIDYFNFNYTLKIILAEKDRFIWQLL